MSLHINRIISNYKKIVKDQLLNPFQVCEIMDKKTTPIGQIRRKRQLSTYSNIVDLSDLDKVILYNTLVNEGIIS